MQSLLIINAFMSFKKLGGAYTYPLLSLKPIHLEEYCGVLGEGVSQLQAWDTNTSSNIKILSPKHTHHSICT